VFKCYKFILISGRRLIEWVAIKHFLERHNYTGHGQIMLNSTVTVSSYNYVNSYLLELRIIAAEGLPE